MTEIATSRRMWGLFEPIHAVLYFAPTTRTFFEEAGFRGFWRGYFATRAAPLGTVGPAPVIASFYGFAPAMVTRALPDVWTRGTPQAAITARQAAAAHALTAVLSDVDPGVPAAAADALRAPATAVDLPGRVLGAANAGLPWPTDPVEALWHATTILREHRGDGHIAALLTAGIGGLESLVWKASLFEGGRGLLQPARGWTDEEWAATTAALADRGLVTADGAATAAGRALDAEVEDITDRLAAAPWETIGAAATEACAELLRPIAVRAAAYLPPVNPVGRLPSPA
jgi:hypothetical protein